MTPFLVPVLKLGVNKLRDVLYIDPSFINRTMTMELLNHKY